MNPPPQAGSIPPATAHPEVVSDERAEGWRVLKKRAVRGSVWVVIGQTCKQVVRLGGNLVLTRLLFPEAFGLMKLVEMFTLGAEMFSDIGLQGSIIHHRRGDDESFLNTAWTLQIIRGAILWLVLCALSWPVSRLYGQPAIFYMLPVVGFTLLINGFDSTAKHSLIRKVTPGRQISMELASRAIGLVVMILVAFVTRSVWSLVVGALVISVLKLGMSHFLIANYRNRFGFDAEAFWEHFHFGKWIFLSTAMTFFLTHGDLAVLGVMITPAEIGIYSIAAILARTVSRSLMMVSRRVFVPVYARIAEMGPDELRRKTLAIRSVLMALSLPPIWAMAIWGREIVGFLYDPRYSEAGWMLQILAVGQVGDVIAITTGSVLLARGDSFRQFMTAGTRAAVYLTALLIGGSFYGLQGILVGIVVSKLFAYWAVAVSVRKYDVWLPWLDLLAAALSAAVIGLGLAVF